MTLSARRTLCASGAAALLGLALLASDAAAQIPRPPATAYGSVTDSAGPVSDKVPVVAYIGDVECGRKETVYTGDGPARVTVYAVDVLSKEQKPGCGESGKDIRIKIGDRFADDTAKWEAGPVLLNVTFGEATPAPIPTFTPTPIGRNTPVPDGTGSAGGGTGGGQGGTGEGQGGTGEPVGTIPAGSPGAGSPFPTRPGGLTSSTPGAAGVNDDDGGGFPLWAVVVLVLGGVAVVGGGVGYALSRNRVDESRDDHLTPLD